MSARAIRSDSELETLNEAGLREELEFTRKSLTEMSKATSLLEPTAHSTIQGIVDQFAKEVTALQRRERELTRRNKDLQHALRERPVCLDATRVEDNANHRIDRQENAELKEKLKTAETNHERTKEQLTANLKALKIKTDGITKKHKTKAEDMANKLRECTESLNLAMGVISIGNGDAAGDSN